MWKTIESSETLSHLRLNHTTSPSPCRRLTSQIIISLSSLVFSIVVITVSSDFYRDESLLAATLEYPHELGTYVVCPAVLPTKLFLDAGYSPEVARVVQQITSVFSTKASQHTPDDGINSHFHDAQMGEQTFSNISIQKVLMDVATVLDMNTSIEAAKRGGQINLYLSKNKIILTETGFCFAVDWEGDAGKVTPSDTALGWIQLMVHHPPEVWSAIQGHQIGAFLKQSRIMIPPVSSIKNCLVSLNFDVSRIRRRSSIRRNCVSKHNHDARPLTIMRTMEQCFQRKPQQCQIFNPYGNQTLNTLCHGKELRNAVREIRERCKYCLDNNQLCNEYLATYSLHLHHCNSENLSISYRYRAASFSAKWTQDKAVTTSSYISYVAGNLSVFFGLNFIAVFSDLAGVTKYFSKGRQQKTLGKKIQVVIVFVLVSMLIVLMIEPTQSYMNQKTASYTSFSQGNFVSNFMLFGSWMDGDKLKNALDLPQSFWEEEEKIRQDQIRHYHAKNHTGASKPLLCQLLYSILPLTNFLPIFPRTAEFNSRVEYLTHQLNLQKAIQTKGIFELLKSTVADSGSCMFNVTDTFGRHLPHEVNVHPAPSGFAYEVKFGSNVSDYIRSTRSLKFKLLRKTEPDKFCVTNTKGSTDIMLYFGKEIKHEFNFVFLSAEGQNDNKVTVNRKRALLKPRKSRSCATSEAYEPFCISTCFDEIKPCPCIAHFPSSDGTQFPTVRNFSQACHSYLPNHMDALCPMIRFTISPDVYRRCRNRCMMPCEMEAFPAVQTFEVSTDDKFRTVTVVYDNVRNAVIQEFYIYNFVSYLCTACACVSLIFGFSFVGITGETLLILGGHARKKFLGRKRNEWRRH